MIDTVMLAGSKAWHTLAQSAAETDIDSGRAAAARALSIRQPWTWAILYAGKRVENRTWYTDYRGPIFIHAGLRVDWAAVDDLRDEIEAVPEPRPAAFCGGLVATAILADCVKPDQVPEGQRDWAVGPWCFLLRTVTPLVRPVSHPGALGLFSVHPRAELVARASLPNTTKYGGVAHTCDVSLTL